VTEGADYSWGRPGGAALVAAGKTFAIRYLDYPGAGGKGLTAAELVDLRVHLLAVGLVFESTAGRARGGAAAGAADGHAAFAARAALGIPPGVAIFFAVDWDAQPADQPAIDAYLRAAGGAGAPGDVGVYGSADVLDRCHARGSAAHFWQTYAWSHGRISSAAGVYQYRNTQTIRGALVDFDRSLVPSWGQWPAPAPAPSSVPTYLVTIRGATPVYARPGGARVGTAWSMGAIATRQLIGGHWWYHLISARIYQGRWMPAEPTMTATLRRTP